MTDDPTFVVTGFCEIEPLDRRGAFGVVYRARQLAPERIVAIKSIPDNVRDIPSFVARFQREVTIVSNLVHPHILPLFEYRHEGGRMLFVMPFVDGGTLEDRFERRDFDPSFCLNLVEKIGSALDYAHRRGIVHRDVKPSNILLSIDGEPYLADFGIALPLEQSRLTETSVALGTVDYMSPEQVIRQPLDGRSDLYALGLILYRLVAGRLAFTGDSPFLRAIARVNDRPVPPSQVVSGIGPALDSVVMRAISQQPSDRYSSGREFADALRSAVRGVASPDQAADPVIEARPLTAPLSSTRESTRPSVHDRTEPALPGGHSSLADTVPTVPAIGRSARAPWRDVSAVVALAVIPLLCLVIGISIRPPGSQLETGTGGSEVAAPVALEVATATAEPTEPAALATEPPPTETPLPPPEPTATAVPRLATATRVIAVPPSPTVLPQVAPTGTALPATPTRFPTPSFFAPTNTPAPTQTPRQGGDDGGSCLRC